MEIKVIKRDGELEAFDSDKVARVVQAAGLRPVEAEELSKRIADWAEDLGQPQVSSLKIRDKVFEELEKTDKYASGLFAWYQSTKEKNDKI